MLENKMSIKYIVFLIILLISVILYTIPKLFIAVPKTITIGKIDDKSEYAIVLPRGEGFEPWIAIENCKTFDISFQVFDENNEEVYDTSINNSSKQLERLGNLFEKYKKHIFCKYPIVQDGRKKWKLFQHGNKYTIKVHATIFPKNTNIYFNLDYLSIWFPRSVK